MSKYVEFTEAEVFQANHASLEDFLRNHGETLIRSGTEWRWKRGEHDSITIRGNNWYDWVEDEGGKPVRFLMKYFNMDFPGAMYTLLGLKDDTHTLYYLARKQSGKKRGEPVIVPARNDNYRRMFAYLTKVRGISGEIVSFFVRQGTLYESREHHNAVFTGRDENGKIRYVMEKGTLSDVKGFCIEPENSLKEYSFCYTGTGNRLFVFEAPVDLLSYITLFPANWQQNSYLSLGGVSGKALLHFLSVHPNIQEVTFCLDNDEKGRAASERLRRVLTETGYETIKTGCYFPDEKDWNDQLKKERGLNNGR